MRTLMFSLYLSISILGFCLVGLVLKKIHAIWIIVSPLIGLLDFIILMIHFGFLSNDM